MKPLVVFIIALIVLTILTGIHNKQKIHSDKKAIGVIVIIVVIIAMVIASR